MKYFKMYKEDGATAEQITKEEAMRILEGWWKKEALDEIFENGTEFRLFTPYADVWTNKDGKVPIAGFYGTVG